MATSTSTTTPTDSKPIELRHDLISSLVVFLIALPLSLGIALASGAPIQAGIIAAVCGGLVVGALGGAPLQVAGPAAGLTALMVGLVEQCKGHGDWRAVTFIVACAGVLQLALGAARVARWAMAIPPSVVHGMLAAIGILIFLGQAHVVLGFAPGSTAFANLTALPGHIAAMNPWAALLGVGTTAAILLWPLLPARARRIPAPLVVLFVATLASLPLHDAVERIRLSPEGASTSLVAALRLPTVPDLPVWDVCVSVVGVCLIASVESLLCAVATDKLHQGPRARLDRELFGQGAANLVSGLLGGLPVTGVIVRSKANIDAGARTRLSAILHGVWLLLFVAALGPVVEQVPKAVLAGLLVTVGVKLVTMEPIRQLLKHEEAAPYFVTVGAILIKDLLTGVCVGLVLSAALLLHRLTAMTVVTEERDEGTDVVIKGALTFRNVPRLTAELAKVPPGRAVAVDLDLTSIDHAGWDALHGWRLGHERTGAKVVVDGLEQAFSPNAPGLRASERLRATKG